MCPLLTWTSEWTEIRKWTLITGHGRAIPPALGPTAWQEDTVGNRLGLIKRSGVLGMGWVRSDHGPLSLSSTPRAAQSRGELLAGCLGWAVGPPPALSCDQGCRLAPPSSGPKSKVSISPSILSSPQSWTFVLLLWDSLFPSCRGSSSQPRGWATERPSISICKYPQEDL